MSNRISSHLAARVLWLRHAQLAINEMIGRGAFKIPVHLALGHEAIAIAVVEIMSNDDRLLLSHRNLHYNLAICRDLKSVTEEFMGLPSGRSQGRQGSMNLSQPDKGLVYTSSILGNNLPVAVGVGKALKDRGGRGVPFVVTGDGAMEEGAFYESLLMAGSASVPMVVIVENNGWSMYTQIADRRRPIDLEKFAESLGYGYAFGRGADIQSLVSACEISRAAALESGAPFILEVELSTLGDFTENERVINYHHGRAPKVEWRVDAILDDSASDPVAWIRDTFSEEEFSDLATTEYRQVKGACS